MEYGHYHSPSLEDDGPGPQHLSDPLDEVHLGKNRPGMTGH